MNTKTESTTDRTMNGLMLKALLMFVMLVMILMDFVGLSSLVSIDYENLTMLGAMGLSVAFIIAVITNLIHSNPLANARVGYIGTLITVAATVMFSANTIYLVLDTTGANRTNAEANNAGLEAESRASVMKDVTSQIDTLSAKRKVIMNSKAVGYKGKSKHSVAAATLSCGDPEKMASLSDKSRRYKLEWIAFNQAACDEITAIDAKIKGLQSPTNIKTLVQAGISSGWVNTKEMNLIEKYALNSEGMKETMSYLLAFLLVVLVHILREVVHPSANDGTVRRKQIKTAWMMIKYVVGGVFSAPLKALGKMYSQFALWRKHKVQAAQLKSIAGGTPIDRAMILTRGEYSTQGDGVKDAFLAVMNSWPGNEGKPIPGGTYAWIKANTVSPHRRINNTVCANAVEFCVRHGVLVNTNPTASKQQRRYAWGKFNIEEVKQYRDRKEVSDNLKEQASA